MKKEIKGSRKWHILKINKEDPTADNGKPQEEKQSKETKH